MNRRRLTFLFLSLVLVSCEREENPLNVPGPTPVAPAVPALVAPAQDAAGQSIPAVLAWGASTGATSYGVQVSRDAQFTDIVFNLAGLSATGVTVGDLSIDTRYWWRVNAKNAAGASAWSSARKFTTFALGVPSHSQPSDGVAGQPLTVTVSWTAVAGADGYDLQVSIDSTFTNPRAAVVDDSALTVAEREIAGLCRTSTYFWRVRVRSGSHRSAWSSPWRFSTIAACGTPSVAHDGQEYGTVSIRNQCWLDRNIDAGTMIHSGAVATAGDAAEKFCYDDDPANCAALGGLYSWGEAMRYDDGAGARGICPDGWHVPTRADIEALSAAVCDTALSRHYVSAADGGTNETGFGARLAGYFDFGYFGERGDVAKFWLSERDNAGRAYYWVLGRTGYALTWVRADLAAGYSVRCIRD